MGKDYLYMEGRNMGKEFLTSMAETSITNRRTSVAETWVMDRRTWLLYTHTDTHTHSLFSRIYAATWQFISKKPYKLRVERPIKR